MDYSSLPRGGQADEVISKPKPEARRSAPAGDRATAFGDVAQRGDIKQAAVNPKAVRENVATFKAAGTSPDAKLLTSPKVKQELADYIGAVK